MNLPQDDSPVAWHALSVQALVQRLAVDPARGLDAAQVAGRRAAHGANELPQPPPRPLWRLVGRQLRSPLIYLLFVAAALALALGERADAAVILAVVLLNTLVGSFQEGRAERSMAALRRLAVLRSRVLRNGAERSIEARELVPGDVLLIAAGDAVGADARVVEAAQLQADEAALTGESLPVPKHAGEQGSDTLLAERACLLHAGTHVVAGRARAIVVATGASTEVGRIAALTERAGHAPTPLEQRIARFGRMLALAALGLFVLVMLLGAWRGLPLTTLLMVAISQMVSMVPEGLPVAMTIALAVGMQRMAARGAIVRRLSAVETLGSTTVICSDKTGTLTKNEMTVVALWLPDGRTLGVGGVGYAPEGVIEDGGRAVDAATDPSLRALLEAAALCNDAQLLAPAAPSDAWSALGDPTEAALLVLAHKGGVDVPALRRLAPRRAELPFDADVKLMATQHALGTGAERIFVKGAPEAVVRLLGESDAARAAAIHAAAEAMAARALRVLAVAAADDAALGAGFGALAGRLRLLGLVGQIDPPRIEARAAVDECRGAGIRPVMITGDHPATGWAIARDLGIARATVPDAAVLDGAALERLDDAQLAAVLPQVAVFARVQPAQKLRIVRALQARGEVTAMTGDGVNDAPALAQSDIGVAMGRAGTEVAKGAADIVIADDDFATIVAAVREGRGVYANLKKVILFLFATSIDEVLVLLLAIVAGVPLPLLAVQILWINIVTEGTLTLNLVLDAPDDSQMQRPPTPREAPLLDRSMIGRAALMALTAAGVAFAWFVWRLQLGLPIEQVRTELFTLVAVSQWFNALNCQSARRSVFARGAFRNRWLVLGLVLSVLLQAAVLYAPPLNTLFHTVPLGASTLVALLGLASSVLWVEEARKAWQRRFAPAHAGATGGPV